MFLHSLLYLNHSYHSANQPKASRNILFLSHLPVSWGVVSKLNCFLSPAVCGSGLSLSLLWDSCPDIFVITVVLSFNLKQQCMMETKKSCIYLFFSANFGWNRSNEMEHMHKTCQDKDLLVLFVHVSL